MDYEVDWDEKEHMSESLSFEAQVLFKGRFSIAGC